MKKTLSILICGLSMCILASCGGSSEDPLISKYKSMAVSQETSFDFSKDLDGWEKNVLGQNNVSWIQNNKKLKPGLKINGKESQKDDSPNASIFNKFLVTSKTKTFVFDASTITDIKTNLRIRAITFDDNNPNYNNLTISNGEYVYDAYGYCKLDGSSQTVLTYDLSSFIGQKTVISIDYKNISEDINEGLFINNIELVEKYSYLDVNTSWNKQDILSKWQLRGNIINDNDSVILNNKASGSSLFNVIRPLSDSGYLKIEMSKEQSEENIFSVTVDNETLSCVNQKEYDFTSKLEKVNLIYDLKANVDCIINLEIKNNKKIDLKIHSIELIPSKGGYVFDTDWNSDSIYDDWNKTGSVAKHSEGTCIEFNANNPSSISNIIKVTDQYCYFNMAFRKFVRSEGAQDIDPKIEVYINDQLIRYIGATEDYASATSNEYTLFTYDLNAYIGQKVTVKLLSVAGPHACFNHIYLSNQIGE